ncbi:MAG TPA: VC0807 family protein [Bdellovibrionales bacterium]|nr:VC0807 family protein [Bdellovibrionales bacterium]
MTTPASNPTPRPSPFVGIFLNIVIPVAVLNQVPERAPELAHKLGAWGILFVALLFPIAGAIREFVQQKKVGVLPALGLLNVLGTGGLAAAGVEGVWFAVKEAFFPLLIGAVVVGSLWTRKPLGRAIFLNEAFLNRENIEKHIASIGKEPEFTRSLRTATFLLGGSFLFSAILNFIIATIVFAPIAPDLSPDLRAVALNQQVARMTWLGFVVIAVPSFAITAFAFFRLFRDLKRMTGFTDEQIFKA